MKGTFPWKSTCKWSNNSVAKPGIHSSRLCSHHHQGTSLLKQHAFTKRENTKTLQIATLHWGTGLDWHFYHEALTLTLHSILYKNNIRTSRNRQPDLALSEWFYSGSLEITSWDKSHSHWLTENRIPLGMNIVALMLPPGSWVSQLSAHCNRNLT